MINYIKKTSTVLTLVAALGASSIACAADTAVTASTSASTTSATTATVAAKVNMNTADAQAIAGKVKGIGVKRAEAIVAYRTEHGAFKSFDDLAQVKGIGESFVTKNADALNQAFTLS